MVEVLLEEDDPPEHVDLLRGPSLPRRLGARWSTRPGGLRSGAARLGAVVGALGLVAVVAQQGSVAAAEGALSARLAATAGLSVPLDEPLREVWHLEDSWPQGRLDGDLLVMEQSAGRMVRLDPSTGEVRWSATVSGWCTPLEENGGGAFPDGLIPRLTGERLVCEGMDPTVADGWASRVVLLSVADGAVQTGPALDGAPLGTTLVEGDVVLSAQTADGRLLAQRWSPESGQTVWSHRGTEPVVDPAAGYGIAWGPGYLQIDGSRTLLLDLASGREIATPDEATSDDTAFDITGEVVTLADGSLVGGSVSEGTGLSWTAADGTARPDFPGWPVVPGSDDGSGGAVAFASLADGMLAAVDLDAQEVRWTAQASEGWGISAVVAVLDGRVLLARGGSVAVADVATGEELWSRERSTDQWGAAAVTDGRALAYVERPVQDGTGLTGPMVLTAVDLATGEVVARTPLGSGSAALLGCTPDGTVLVMTEEGGLVGLRP